MTGQTRYPMISSRRNIGLRQWPVQVDQRKIGTQAGSMRATQLRQAEG